MKPLKIICVDGFKYSYLQHAPYLTSLTRSYQHGKLTVTPGYWGAMDTFFNGTTTMLSFFYYTLHSSWKTVKYFTWLGNFLSNCYINLFRLLKGHKLFYAYHIPLNKLHLYDTHVTHYFSKPYKIDYTYIGELDTTGHLYGTTARETITCIKKIDRYLASQDFDILLSDNGMMDVKETVSVPETRACFIDSALARYWGEKPRNMPRNKGTWITWKDKRYGDHIFQAKPGVLFLPNYWQGNNPVKGMHGYDPKHEDMKTFYIIKRKGTRKDLTIQQLHNIFKQIYTTRGEEHTQK